MDWCLPRVKDFMSDVAGRSGLADHLATQMILLPYAPDDEQESLGSLSIVRPLDNSCHCKRLPGELAKLILLP